jgi:hypothetical protein
MILPKGGTGLPPLSSFHRSRCRTSFPHVKKPGDPFLFEHASEKDIVMQAEVLFPRCQDEGHFGCGEYQESGPPMAEHQELHLASQRRAVPLMVLSVHPEVASFAVYIEISGRRVKKRVILASRK